MLTLTTPTFLAMPAYPTRSLAGERGVALLVSHRPPGAAHHQAAWRVVWQGDAAGAWFDAHLGQLKAGVCVDIDAHSLASVSGECIVIASSVRLVPKPEKTAEKAEKPSTAPAFITRNARESEATA